MDSTSNPSVAMRFATLALIAATVYTCWPLWPAIVIAAWTAEIARHSLLARFEKGLRGRRRAAAVFSLVLFLGLVTPVLFLAFGVAIGASDIAQQIAGASTATQALQGIVSGGGGDSALPFAIPTNVGGWIELAREYGAQGFAVLSQVAGAAATAFVTLLIYFGGSYSFLVDGERAWAWIKRHLPFKGAHLDRLSAAFHETGRGLLIGVGLTSATQGLVATIIYFSLGVPRAWVLGPITGVASMIPFVGSALVWSPIAIGFFLTDHPIKAAILAALGIAVIGTADNVLQPLFARYGSLRMPTYLLFLSIFGGLASFGALGAVLGPLIVRLTIEALEIWKEDREA